MKNTSRKGSALFLFLMFLVFWAKAADLLAMGTNQGEAPLKNESLKPFPPVSETIQAVVPAGTPFKVQLNQSIRTSTHRSGQSFFATLKDPIVIGGKVLIQTGVPFIGVISQSRESGHFSGSALIELQLTRMIMADGTTLAISTETFKKIGQAHFLRNIGLIGIGTILGAGLGIFLGQNPGALIGIGFGGGIGAVLAYVTGKEDLFIKAGTDLGFKTSRPFTVLIQPASAIPSK
jgi:hypothetical protein